MSRSMETNGHMPCPLCGRVTRAHSRLVVSDMETNGLRPNTYVTVICRDCAFAMVLRSEAATLRAAV
jgi:predicted RNA-binding Zn-ribbon protein involved in translation (DUF1610 family)